LANSDFFVAAMANGIALADRNASAAPNRRGQLKHVLYCYSQVCHLAATAAVEFASHRYSVVELEGGFAGWKENELPIEK
jgi:rhodanese-related sulfurtransferase